MLIRYACPDDKEILKNIWQKTFSDTQRFVNWNFENNFSFENAMLCEENGEIVSNLHLIPYDIVLKGRVLKSVYISAVATPKAFRGQGYASKLISEALDSLTKRGIDLAFLVPAIDGFYEQFGFLKIAEKESYTEEGEIPPFCDITETEIPNAKEVLDIYLCSNRKKKFYLKRSLKDTALILNDLIDNTEGQVRMLQDGSAYVMYKEYKDKIKVFELMGKNEEARDEIKYFLFQLGKPLEFELPPVMVKPLNKKTEAEEFLLPREKLYFNLIL